jgi:HEAT repeat protein
MTSRKSKKMTWQRGLAFLTAVLGMMTACAAAGTDPDVTALTSQLRATGLRTRVNAAVSLIELGSGAQHAFPALILALTGDEDLDRMVAARVVYARPRPAGDAIALARALTYETKARVAAAWELSRIGPSAGEETIPALIEALKSEDKHARNFVAVALGTIGPKGDEAVPAFIAVLRDKGSRDTPQTNYRYPRAAAAFTLGMIGPAARASVPVLREDLRARSQMDKGRAGTEWEYHRVAACFALGRVGPDAWEAIPDLKQAVNDENDPVRVWAAEALATIAHPVNGVLPTNRPSETVEVAKVVHVLREPPDRATLRLLSGLRILGKYAAGARPVRKGAGRQAAPVHESVTLALGYLDSLEKTPTPEEIVRQDGQIDGSVRGYLLALGGVQQRIVPVLLESLRASEENPRLLAARNLSSLGPAAKGAVPAIREVLDGPDWVLRMEAFCTLGRIDQP